jgi:hypothetical protein
MRSTMAQKSPCRGFPSTQTVSSPAEPISSSSSNPRDCCVSQTIEPLPFKILQRERASARMTIRKLLREKTPVGAHRILTALRTPLWLASEWGCRGRRCSRV